MIVEVCANSLQSALNAQQAGADRIELCSELGVGGITPSFGLLKAVRELISIPVHVLIRPRSGDFTYSDLECEIMEADILQCREMGFEGVVTGILTSENEVDITNTARLIALKGDMHFTFHRAFDWVKDPTATLAVLDELGVDAVLSSGQQATAIEGLPLLQRLNNISDRLAVMPGAGINEGNISSFIEADFPAVHFSGTEFHQTLTNLPKVSMNSALFLREDHLAIASIEKIKSVIKSVK